MKEEEDEKERGILYVGQHVTPVQSAWPILPFPPPKPSITVQRFCCHFCLLYSLSLFSIFAMCSIVSIFLFFSLLNVCMYVCKYFMSGASHLAKLPSII